MEAGFHTLDNEWVTLPLFEAGNTSLCSHSEVYGFIIDFKDWDIFRQSGLSLFSLKVKGIDCWIRKDN